jgi:hypothetical protein
MHKIELFLFLYNIKIINFLLILTIYLCKNGGRNEKNTGKNDNRFFHILWTN